MRDWILSALLRIHDRLPEEFHRSLRGRSDDKPFDQILTHPVALDEDESERIGSTTSTSRYGPL